MHLVFFHKFRRYLVQYPIPKECLEPLHKIAIAAPGELCCLCMLNILISQFIEPDCILMDVKMISALENLRRLNGLLQLIDMVAIGMESPGGEARAQMIRLETRAPAPMPPMPFDPVRVMPAWVVQASDGRMIVLSRDEDVIRMLETQADLGTRLLNESMIHVNDFVIHVRQSSTYSLNRKLYDCLVIRPALA